MNTWNGRLLGVRGLSGILLVAVAILPCLFSWHAYGPPQPRISDEFNYLLGARTFLLGRLSNPPVDPEFFGASFTLSSPTYVMKYQPGPSVLMALGKMVFGNEYAGVLLSVALLVLAVRWMCEAFMPPAHSFLIALFCAVRFGWFHYWAVSYWGGVLPATGAALLVGAYGRCLRVWRPRHGAALGLGASVLALTRPFEGCLLAAPVLCHLAWRFWKARRSPTEGPARLRTALAFSALVGLYLVGQAVYDRSTTGNLLVPPFVRYPQLYHYVPFFWLQGLAPGKPYPNEHLRYTHTVYDYAVYRKIVDLGPVARTRFLLERLGRKLNVLGLVSLLPLLAVPLLWAKDPILRYLSVIGLIQAAGLLTETWLLPHYLAGVVPLVLAVLGRSVFLWGERFSRPGAALGMGAAILLVPALWASVPSFRVYYEGSISKEGISRRRERVADTLARFPGKHLAFTRYNMAIDIRDWVHNGPDLNAEGIVWARDLGPARDQRLWRTSFPERHCWLVIAEGPVTDLSPCGDGSP